MIELSWDPDAEAVILWTFSPGWTWNDFHAAIDKTEIMMRDRMHELKKQISVDLIFLMHLAPNWPSGSPFTPIGRGMREIAKGDGIVVVTVGSMFTRSVINVVRRGIVVGGSRLYPAANLDEAHKQVTRYRQAEAAKKQAVH